jgi:uncharacterized repeat protein (TIGR03803 family)
MNKNLIFPNWQLPRRQPFYAGRGIALLRALRLRLAEQTQERCVQTQLEFGLIEATDGRLYGVTPTGGLQDYGTVFRVDPKAFSESATQATK